jgi:hypothetical protein
MDRCTAVGQGFLELVDFTDESDYTVRITDTAVRANAMLSWTPGTLDLAVLRKVLHWLGRDNRYDVRGKPWVVHTARGAPLPDGPSDPESWRALMTEEDALHEPIHFRIDPSAESLSTRPPDFTITNAGPKVAGADPDRVGPW